MTISGGGGPLYQLDENREHLLSMVKDDVLLSATLHANIATAISDSDAEKAAQAADALADYLDDFVRATFDSPLALSR